MPLLTELENLFRLVFYKYVAPTMLFLDLKMYRGFRLVCYNYAAPTVLFLDKQEFSEVSLSVVFGKAITAGHYSRPSQQRIFGTP